MCVSVSSSLAYVEQGRSTCNASRSLSVEPFATQRVCVGEPNRRECCRSLASSPAESIDNHRENPSKIDAGRSPGAPKIDPKSVPRPSWGAPWRQRASRRRLGSVSGASWGVPGAPWERPESPQGRPETPGRAPESVRERAEATKIDAESRPQAKTPSFFRSARSRSVVGPIFRRFSSVFGFSAKPANPLKYCACQQKQRVGPLRCESRRSFEATSKNHEIRPKN